MVPWIACPSIELDLEKTLAERFRAVPQSALVHARWLLDFMHSGVPDKWRFAADLVRLRTGNRFSPEAHALARVVGDDWRTVMLASVSYELVLCTMGCSTVALATADGPVLARNMDWAPERLLAQTSYLIRSVRNGRLAWAHAGWPGAIGVVTGLSYRGFAVALNAVWCSGTPDWLGYPVLLHLRRVVEDAADFQAAVKLLSRQRLAAGGLFTVVGRSNHERVVIERTPRTCAQRWPDGDAPLVATNHFRLASGQPTAESSRLCETTCTRYDALVESFASPTVDRSVDDEELLYALTDRRVMQGITAQHVLIRPATDAIRLFVPRHLADAD